MRALKYEESSSALKSRIAVLTKHARAILLLSVEHGMFVLRAAFPFFHIKIKERCCRFNGAADGNCHAEIAEVLKHVR